MVELVMGTTVGFTPEQQWQILSQDLKQQFDKYWGELGRNQGELAEEFFFRYFERTLQLGQTTFEDVAKNMRTKYQKRDAEYDIVLMGKETVGIVEVKVKLRKSDIDTFLKSMSEFEDFFPNYKGFHKIGAVAALQVHPSVHAYAKKHGLYVFTQAGMNARELD